MSWLRWRNWNNRNWIQEGKNEYTNKLFVVVVVVSCRPCIRVRFTASQSSYALSLSVLVVVPIFFSFPSLLLIFHFCVSIYIFFVGISYSFSHIFQPKMNTVLCVLYSIHNFDRDYFNCMCFVTCQAHLYAFIWMSTVYIRNSFNVCIWIKTTTNEHVENIIVLFGNNTLLFILINISFVYGENKIEKCVWRQNQTRKFHLNMKVLHTQ